MSVVLCCWKLALALAGAGAGMILLPYRRIVVNNSNNFVMGSKYFLHKPSITLPTIYKSIPVLFKTQRLIFSAFASKPISPNRGTSSFSYRPQRLPPPGTFFFNFICRGSHFLTLQCSSICHLVAVCTIAIKI